MKFNKQWKQSQGIFLSMFLTLSCFFAALSPATAQVRCESLYLGPVAYGQIRTDFEHNNRYSEEVLFQSDVMDQCQLGTCHLHSWISSLEHDYNDHFQGPPLKLSSHYLTATYWLLKSYDVLRNPDSNISVNLGAEPIGSRNFILAAGLIPDYAWTGTTSFQEKEQQLRIQAYIENIIGRTKWARDHEINEEKKKQIIAEGLSQIEEVFKNFIGNFKAKFQFDGKTFDPQTFAQTYFSQLIKPVVMLIPIESNLRKTKVDLMTGAQIIRTTMDETEKIIRDMIDHHQTVFLGYDHQSAYVDLKTGIMSISAFQIPNGAQPLNGDQRNYFSKELAGHAVQIVGYDLDPKTNKVIKWKIKNSWGTKVGDRGYFHMYDDYFRQFVVEAAFFKINGVELPQGHSHDPQQFEFNFPPAK